MTSEKEPVLLVILLRAEVHQWFAGGIALDGTAWPLLRSEPGNYDDFVPMEFDEQVSFLRHRMAGVLQRGCDRLWGQKRKPCHIVFVADQPLGGHGQDLTFRLADHFVTWMSSPPVAFFVGQKGFDPHQPETMDLIAGNLNLKRHDALHAGLHRLWEQTQSPEDWEVVHKPRPAAN